MAAESWGCPRPCPEPRPPSSVLGATVVPREGRVRASTVQLVGWAVIRVAVRVGVASWAVVLHAFAWITSRSPLLRLAGLWSPCRLIVVEVVTLIETGWVPASSSFLFAYDP